VSRLVAFDHGTRRIGVAVADSEAGIAFARPALRGRAARDPAAPLALVRSEAAETVVVGLPRNMDGTEGPQAAAARSFGAVLEAAGVAVVFVDERLSSWEAGQQLKEAGRQASRASGELDSAAARLILQDYLDTERTPEPRGAPQEHESR
jgi:putative Holliday junction resolvase